MKYSLATFRRKSPFMSSVREKARILRLSIRTEEAYAHWISAFLCWSGWKTPKTLTSDDVTRYLSSLATERKVSASTQNQAFNALLFLFRRVLEKEFGEVKAVRAKASVNVPEFFSRDELKLIFSKLENESLLLARLAYGTGMRLMELLRLRIKDVDFSNGVITIRRGKGDKDRVVPLPKSLAAQLKSQVESAKALHAYDLSKGFGEVWMPEALALKFSASDPKWQYVFHSRRICRDPRDGKMRRHHLFETGFQQVLARVGRDLGLSKRVHPHAFRHSFATHFLENGGSLQQLQQLLGHKEVTTTMIYLHCLDNSKARSPLDAL